ncbi:hypothetical protein M513_05488 [Trichuris suis]|uniref:Polyprenal reductase n=1 Tax=Trichuris suis TaxID=68888 RepID=A0A085M8M6_9BILA|nr:hypothetical protein M513_05488 [Trichuris suis]
MKILPNYHNSNTCKSLVLFKVGGCEEVRLVKCDQEKITVSLEMITQLIEEYKKKHKRAKRNALALNNSLEKGSTGLKAHKKRRLRWWRYEIFHKSEKAKWEIIKGINRSSEQVIKIVSYKTEYVRASLWESQLLKTMNHENIVTFLGHKMFRAMHHFHYEFLSGGTLEWAVIKGLPVDMAIQYFKQLMSGIEYLHKRSITVRNLQLKHLLLSRNNVLKITNFTEACYFHDPKGQEIMQQGQSAPIEYMAPETFGGNEYRAESAEIFTCGIILFAMLTSEFPWEKAQPECSNYDSFGSTDVWYLSPFSLTPYKTRMLASVNLTWMESFWAMLSLAAVLLGVATNFYTDLFTSMAMMARYANIGKVKLPRWRLTELPSRWFTHFYIVATFTSELALTLSVLRLTGFVMHDAKPVIILQDVLSFLRQPVGTMETPTSTPSPRLNEATIVLCCFLFFAQALRRFFESAFLSVYSDTKMNIFHYLLGIVHYVMVPCSILIEGPSLTSPSIEESEASDIISNTYFVGALNKLTLMQWFGVALFVWASLKQHECFRILSAMRRGYSGDVLTHLHGVPQGGWFDYVACPHFFFEIIIYISIWVCQNLTWNTWSFVVIFVTVNQMIAASITREWYIRKFPEVYPTNRMALIPYIF